MCNRCQDCKGINFIRNARNNRGGVCLFLKDDPTLDNMGSHACKPWVGENKCDVPGSDKDWFCCSEGMFFLKQATKAPNITAGTKICTCTNGQAGEGTECPSNGAAVCQSCDPGFTLSPKKDECLQNKCTC